MRGLKKIAFICAAAILTASCGGGGGGGGGGQPPAQRKKPPQAGGPQTVDLFWKQSQNKWKVKLSGNPNEQDPKTAKTDLAPGTGPTMFQVNIHDHPTATFKASGGLTVWEGAGTGGAKAPPPATLGSTQIIGPIVTNNGKTLIFFDLNYGGPVTVNYALHFDGTVPSVDPIVENGGGEWQ